MAAVYPHLSTGRTGQRRYILVRLAYGGAIDEDGSDASPDPVDCIAQAGGEEPHQIGWVDVKLYRAVCYAQSLNRLIVFSLHGLRVYMA